MGRSAEGRPQISLSDTELLPLSDSSELASADLPAFFLAFFARFFAFFAAFFAFFLACQREQGAWQLE